MKASLRTLAHPVIQAKSISALDSVSVWYRSGNSYPESKIWNSYRSKSENTHPGIQATSVFTLHSVSWFCCITDGDSLAILCRKSWSGAGCSMCQECIGYLHRKGNIWSRFHIGFISVWVWHLATSHIMRDVNSQTTIFALDSVSVWYRSGSSYPESQIWNS